MNLLNKHGVGLAIATTILLASTGCASSSTTAAPDSAPASVSASAEPSATASAVSNTEAGKAAQEMTKFYGLLLTSETVQSLQSDSLNPSKVSQDELVDNITEEFSDIAQFIHFGDIKEASLRAGLLQGLAFSGGVMKEVGITSVTVPEEAVTIDGDKGLIDMEKIVIEGTEFTGDPAEIAGTDDLPLIKVKDQWQIDAASMSEAAGA